MADIRRELTSDQNKRFILHDSRGFEHGDTQNLSLVKDFIQSRRGNQDIKEQLHAVWCADLIKAIIISDSRCNRMCFQIPNVDAGQRMTETGMEEFLQQKKEILGDGVCGRSSHFLFNADLYQFRRFSYLRNTICLPLW